MGTTSVDDNAPRGVERRPVGAEGQQPVTLGGLAHAGLAWGGPAQSRMRARMLVAALSLSLSSAGNPLWCGLTPGMHDAGLPRCRVHTVYPAVPGRSHVAGEGVVGPNNGALSLVAGSPAQLNITLGNRCALLWVSSCSLRGAGGLPTSQDPQHCPRGNPCSTAGCRLTGLHTLGRAAWVCRTEKTRACACASGSLLRPLRPNRRTRRPSTTQGGSMPQLTSAVTLRCRGRRISLGVPT
jgi:hypothetical protein